MNSHFTRREFIRTSGFATAAALSLPGFAKADYASRNQGTVISISPGDVRIYRLPTMTRGGFQLNALAFPLRTNFGSGRPDRPPPGSPGSVPTPPPINLLMELLHGDQVVASSSTGLLSGTNSSERDDTWQLRLRLSPNAPAGEQCFTIGLIQFPSILPVLSRRIPLAFFQQGFDSNWKGRNYISLKIETGKLIITFDPELASYYNLPNKDIPIADLELTNPILATDINLSVGVTDGPHGSLAGPLPFVLLTVKFSGSHGEFNKYHIGWDLDVDPFTIEIRFFIIALGDRVSYNAEIAAPDFRSKLHGNFDIVLDHAADAFNSKLKEGENFLNDRPRRRQFGETLTPWLLGAGFDVLNVRQDPMSSQDVQGSLGDLVIQYVGQAPINRYLGPVGEFPNAPTTLTITTASMAAGIVGQAYSEDFQASGGTGQITWSISGTLPPGTQLTGNRLSGTPTTAGVYQCEVTARDAAGVQSSRSYAVAVNPHGISISTSSLADAVVGQPYAVKLETQNVASSLTWEATGLPVGLSISAWTGVISGTPSGPASVATVIAQLTNAQGVSAWKVFSLKVWEALLFSDPPVEPTGDGDIKCREIAKDDPLYAPRGEGDTIWRPRVVLPGFGTIAPGPVGLPTPPVQAGDIHNLNKVDHIVVLMMENRSFDHMLGYLSREGGRTDVEGLKWESGDGRTQFNYYKGRYYYPNLLTDTRVFKTEAMSPDHSHESVKAQMADGMMHFVSNYAKTKVGDDPSLLKLVMGYYGAEQLPTYDMLAREFAICDHWFCSHPGPTWPNRFVSLTGELNRDSYGEPEVNTPLFTDFTPSEATTMFDLLTARGVSWQYFQQRASQMRAFTRFSFDMTNVLEFEDPDKGFEKTVESGGLKSVTFVDPLFGDLPAGVNEPQDNDDAPPSDLQDGQRFINSVVNTLFRSNNPKWDKTMLIIVYDEHGGFYDHVEPPADALPLIGQNSGKLGPRVPAFVVSAWTPRQHVLKDIFDHGTIAATILRRFCSPNPPVLSPRVTAARDLRDALPLGSPRGELTPLFGTRPASLMALRRRTSIRRFKAPRSVNGFGSFLGAMALSLGATPRSSGPQ